MSVTIAGITFGPPAPALRPQPYEVGPAFGPCESGESSFCEGRGTERMAPEAMLAPAAEFLDLSVALATKIVCGPCAAQEKTWSKRWA